MHKAYRKLTNLESVFEHRTFDPIKGQGAHPRLAPCILRSDRLGVFQMVMQFDERQRSGPTIGAQVARGGPVVAFDFDGTLTTRDSFTDFLRWRDGAFSYGLGLARLAPAAMRWVGNRDRAQIKAAAVRTFLRGMPRALLEEEAHEFATLTAPLLLRPDALKVWRRHRSHGARMVIVTASPEIVVAPFARGLGADVLIGTKLLFDQNDRVVGCFEGNNCHGPEKAKRLREVFGDDIRLHAAYGDSIGDREMLDMADEKYMRLFVADPARNPG